MSHIVPDATLTLHEPVDFYLPLETLSRADVESQIVRGTCFTSPEVESDNWVLPYEVLKEAAAEYEGAIRSMHRPDIASGVAVETSFDDVKRTAAIVAEIVDDQEWKKCVKRVYKYFSVGFKPSLYVQRGDGKKVIRKGRWTETSLCDLGKDRGAKLQIARAEGETALQDYDVELLVEDKKSEDVARAGSTPSADEGDGDADVQAINSPISDDENSESENITTDNLNTEAHDNGHQSREEQSGNEGEGDGQSQAGNDQGQRDDGIEHDAGGAGAGSDAASVANAASAGTGTNGAAPAAGDGAARSDEQPGGHGSLRRDETARPGSADGNAQAEPAPGAGDRAAAGQPAAQPAGAGSAAEPGERNEVTSDEVTPDEAASDASTPGEQTAESTHVESLRTEVAGEEDVERKFDPRQPRDDDGKWGDGAGGISAGHAVAVMKHEGISDAKHHEAVKKAIENGTHKSREDVLKHIDSIHEKNEPVRDVHVLAAADKHGVHDEKARLALLDAHEAGHITSHEQLDKIAAMTASSGDDEGHAVSAINLHGNHGDYRVPSSGGSTPSGNAGTKEASKSPHDDLQATHEKEGAELEKEDQAAKAKTAKAKTDKEKSDAKKEQSVVAAKIAAHKKHGDLLEALKTAWHAVKGTVSDYAQSVKSGYAKGKATGSKVEGANRAEAGSTPEGEVARYDDNQPRDDHGLWTVIRGHRVSTTGAGVDESHVHAAADKFNLGEKARGKLLDAHKNGVIKNDHHLYRAIARAVDNHPHGDTSQIAPWSWDEAIKAHGQGGTHEGIRHWSHQGDFKGTTDKELAGHIQKKISEAPSVPHGELQKGQRVLHGGQLFEVTGTINRKNKDGSPGKRTVKAKIVHPDTLEVKEKHGTHLLPVNEKASLLSPHAKPAQFKVPSEEILTAAREHRRRAALHRAENGEGEKGEGDNGAPDDEIARGITSTQEGFPAHENLEGARERDRSEDGFEYEEIDELVSRLVERLWDAYEDDESAALTRAAIEAANAVLDGEATTVTTADGNSPDVGRLETLETDNQALRSTHASLLQRVEIADGDVSRLEIEAETLRGEASVLRGELSTVHEEAQTLRSETETLRADLEAESGEVKRLAGGLSEAEVKASDAAEKVTRLEGETETLRSETETLRSEADTLKSEAGELREERDGLSTRVEKLRSQKLERSMPVAMTAIPLVREFAANRSLQDEGAELLLQRGLLEATKTEILRDAETADPMQRQDLSRRLMKVEHQLSLLPR